MICRRFLAFTRDSCHTRREKLAQLPHARAAYWFTFLRLSASGLKGPSAAFVCTICRRDRPRRATLVSCRSMNVTDEIIAPRESRTRDWRWWCCIHETLDRENAEPRLLGAFNFSRKRARCSHAFRSFGFRIYFRVRVVALYLRVRAPVDAVVAVVVVIVVALCSRSGSSDLPRDFIIGRADFSRIYKSKTRRQHPRLKSSTSIRIRPLVR